MTEYFQKTYLKTSIDEYKNCSPCLDGRKDKQFRTGETICDYDEGFHEIGIIGKGTFALLSAMNTTVPEPSWSAWAPGHLRPPAVLRGQRARRYQQFATAPVTSFSSIMPPSAFLHQVLRPPPPADPESADLIERLKLKPQGGGPVPAHHPRKSLCYFMQLAAFRLCSPSASFTMVDLADYLPLTAAP